MTISITNMYVRRCRLVYHPSNEGCSVFLKQNTSEHLGHTSNSAKTALIGIWKPVFDPQTKNDLKSGTLRNTGI